MAGSIVLVVAMLLGSSPAVAQTAGDVSVRRAAAQLPPRLWEPPAERVPPAQAVAPADEGGTVPLLPAILLLAAALLAGFYGARLQAFGRALLAGRRGRRSP